MNIRKEIDEKLQEIEDREELEKDCTYIQNIKSNIKNTFIKNYEDLRKEFIKKNPQLNTSEILVVNRFVEWLKERA